MYNYVYNKHNINVVEKLDRNFAISECIYQTITLTNKLKQPMFIIIIIIVNRYILCLHNKIRFFLQWKRMKINTVYVHNVSIKL